MKRKPENKNFIFQTKNRQRWNLKRAVSTDDRQRRRIAVDGSESADDNVVDAVGNVFVEDIGVPFDVVSQKIGRSADQQNVV